MLEARVERIGGRGLQQAPAVLERRDSDNEDRTLWDIGFYRERRQGRGFSARLNAIHTKTTAGIKTAIKIKKTILF